MSDTDRLDSLIALLVGYAFDRVETLRPDADHRYYLQCKLCGGTDELRPIKGSRPSTTTVQHGGACSLAEFLPQLRGLKERALCEERLREAEDLAALKLRSAQAEISKYQSLLVAAERRLALLATDALSENVAKAIVDEMVAQTGFAPRSSVAFSSMALRVGHAALRAIRAAIENSAVSS